MLRSLTISTALLLTLAACNKDPLAGLTPKEREIVLQYPDGPARDQQIAYWLTHDADTEAAAWEAQRKRLTNLGPEAPAREVNIFAHPYTAPATPAPNPAPE